MTTDTALGVTKMVVQDKSEWFVSYSRGSCAEAVDIAVPLDKIPYIVS